MSRDASVIREFADGEYQFRLAWGQLRLLQEACDCGPYLVLDRLHSGRWNVDDISQTIRLGLIGGGMEPVPAMKLVRNYVEDRPPLENLALAQVILGAALVGIAEEEVGKKSEAANQEEKTLSPTESSDLPPSMEMAS